jgi:hypothetical protein
MTKEERSWIEKNYRLAYELLDPTLPEKDRRPKIKHQLDHMPAWEVLQETAVMLTKIKMFVAYEDLSDKIVQSSDKPLDKAPESVVSS